MLKIKKTGGAVMLNAILYNEKIREYDLGHVLTGERYQNFMDLFKQELGNNPNFEIVEPDYATESDLKLIHPPEYIKRIESCKSKDPHDTPLSPSIVRAAKLMAGAGKFAGELVQSGKYNKAIGIGGGVQHAGRDYEKGFGIFSDVGICAENLMQNYGVERILILDVDAHAGDGIYEIFSQDTRVLFISIHQNTRTLYPGPRWGLIEQIGKGKGQGYCVNIPLHPWSGDSVYHDVLEEVVSPLAEEFKPEIIIMVDGSDPHFTDRITQMGVTLEGLRMISRKVGKIADKVCQGKVVDFTGSGYSVVTPLGWLASISGLTGVDLTLKEPQPIPRELGYVLKKTEQEAEKVIKEIKGHLGEYWKCFA